VLPAVLTTSTSCVGSPSHCLVSFRKKMKRLVYLDPAEIVYIGRIKTGRSTQKHRA
jgi:hypothetical protein